MRETDIRNENIHRTPHLPGGTVSYTASDGGRLIAGKLVFELDIEPPAPRGHLLAALHAERPDEPASMRVCLDNAAAEQLRRALDSDTTYRSDDGHLTATTTVWVPAALAGLPSYYGAAPYLSGQELQPLSADQEAALPELLRAIREVLPPELHPHAEDILHLAARSVPNHQDVLRSYQRTSAPDVLAAYDQSKEPTRRVDYSGYTPATATRPAHITLEILVDRQSSPANRARLEAAENVLVGGSDQISGTINNLATEHLQKLTRTSARIADEGWAVRVEMDIPAALDTSTHRSADAAGAAVRPPLTAEQETLIPELAETIDAILPPHHRRHTQALALMVAAEVPSTADAITATDRVTLEETIDHHEQRMKGYVMAPPPASMRTGGLSFPQHASAALHHSANSTYPAVASTARPPRISPALER